MWNAVSLFKHYALPLAVSIHLAGVASAGNLSGDPQDVRLPGTPAPRLAKLFVPQDVPDGIYTVTVLAAGIERALGEVRSALGPAAAPGTRAGSWEVRQLEPLEAFGSGSRYDRSKLARLYAGRAVSVVRGPVVRDGRVVAAVTLLSPYPDAAVATLNPGTMAICMRTR